MPSKILILSGAAILSLAASPVFAWTHHHSMHSALHGPSTPAERAQTADLNRQQLAQNAGAEGSAVSTTATGTATQQNGLQTEPTSYQRTGGSAGMNGSAPTEAAGNPTGTEIGRA